MALALFANASDLAPLDALHQFISDMNSHQYSKAYNAFSKGLKEQVSFADFKEGAHHLKSIQLLSSNLLLQTDSMAKARVTIRSIEKLEGETKWQTRKYTGKIVFVPERRHWRVIQVELDGIVRKKRR